MFRIESYITPIILRLVQKYVNNLKERDTQVSLWSGEAVFSNLDLNTSALEELLGLPFRFVNGHIHELRISVPWHKITYEPIVITINTIECVLSLLTDSTDSSRFTNDEHGASQTGEVTEDAEGVASPSVRPIPRTDDSELPKGYLQSIVRRITNNITIVCNNLILKYTEHDLVFSVNVRTVSFRSAGAGWQPEFCDDNDQSSCALLFRRRLVDFSDLTVCLDHRNHTGKIDVFQEPILFRCSMQMRWLMQYSGINASVADVSWISVLCERLNFSVSDRQLPMVWRLGQLAMALSSGTPLSASSSSTHRANQSDPLSVSDSDTLLVSGSEGGKGQSEASWAEWAWSLVPSSDMIFSGNEEDLSKEGKLEPHDRVFRFSVHVKSLDITFKYSSCVDTVRSSNCQRQLKFVPYLQAVLDGSFIEFTRCGVRSTVLRCGVSRVTLSPVGMCTCLMMSPDSVTARDDVHVLCYGSWGDDSRDNYLSDSLFTLATPSDLRTSFRVTHQSYQDLMTDEKILSHSAAAAFDYIYTLDLPDDFSNEHFNQLDTILAQGLPEKSSLRLLIGASNLVIDCGFVHRLEFICHHVVTRKYPPYFELLEPEALLQPSGVTFREHLNSSSVIRVEWKRPSITVACTPFEHLVSLDSKRDTSVRLHCDHLRLTKVAPMRPLEAVSLVARAKRSTEDSLDKCRIRYCCDISSVEIYLISSGFQRSIVSVNSASIQQKLLHFPKLWNRAELAHDICVAQLSELRIDLLTENLVRLMSFFSLGLSAPVDISAHEEDKILLDLKGVSHRRYSNSVVNIFMGEIQNVVLRIQKNEKSAPRVALTYRPSQKSATQSAFRMLLRCPQCLDESKSVLSVYLESSPMQVFLDPIILIWVVLLKSVEFDKDDFRRGSCNIAAIDSIYDTVRQSENRTHSLGNSNSNDRITDYRSQCVGLPRPHCSKSGRSKSSQGFVPSKSARSVSTCSSVQMPSRTPFATFSLWRLNHLEMSVELGSIDFTFPIADLVTCLGCLKSNTVFGNVSVHLKCLSASEVKELSFNSPDIIVKSNKAKTGKNILSYWNEPNRLFLEQSLCNSPWNVELSGVSCRSVNVDGTVTTLLNSAFAECTLGVGPSESVTAIVLHANVPDIEVAFNANHVSVLVNALLFIVSVLDHRCLGNRYTFDESNQPLYTCSQSIPQNTLVKNASSIKRGPCDVPSEAVSVLNQVTFWLQLTLPRVRLHILTECTPVLCVLVDETTVALDMQTVYRKIKLIIGAIDVLKVRGDTALKCELANLVFTSCPRVKNDLKLRTLRPTGRGDECQVGLIDVCSNVLPPVQPDSKCWLSVTLTRALRADAMKRWNKQDLDESNAEGLEQISEVEVHLRPCDFIISSDFLKSFRSIVEIGQILSHLSPHTSASPEYVISCSALPLVYADIDTVRIFLPVEDQERSYRDDMLVVQITGATASLSAEFPISRPILMPEEFQKSQQDESNQIPGSKIEDRQYQVDISEVFLASGRWKELAAVSSDPRPSVMRGYSTMGENPAVEWNHFDPERVPVMRALVPLLDRCSFRAFLVPAITADFEDRAGALVAGYGAELNVISDMDWALDFEHVGLIGRLFDSITTIFKDMIGVRQLITEPKHDDAVDLCFEHQSSGGICSPVVGSVSNKVPAGLVSTDSGFESSNCTMHRPPFQSGAGSTVVVPSEVLLTFGNISLSLYNGLSNVNPQREFIHVTGSNSMKQSCVHRVVPLIHIYFSQPHVFWHSAPGESRVHASIFDFSLLAHQYTDHSSEQCCYLVPDSSCYRTKLLRSLADSLHSDTETASPFLSVSVNDFLSSSSAVDFKLGRPIALQWYSWCTEFFLDIHNQLLKQWCAMSSSSHCGDSSSTNNDNFHDVSSYILRFACVCHSLSLQSGQVLVDCVVCSHRFHLRLGSLCLSARCIVSAPRQLDSFTLRNSFLDASLCTISDDGESEITLISPCSMHLIGHFIWEQWCVSPLVSLHLKSECLSINIGSKQLHVLKTLLHSFEIFSSERRESMERPEDEALQSLTIDATHFAFKTEDDLRKGSMVYIQGDQNSVCPINHVLFDNQAGSMTWRYSETRYLTDVIVLPVPFVDGSSIAKQGDGDKNRSISVRCDIQYFDHAFDRFSTVCDFCLSEEQNKRLQLPIPVESYKTPLSNTWRIRTGVSTNDDSYHSAGLCSVQLSVNALAACVIINSSVQPLIVPRFTAAFDVSSVELRCHVDGSWSGDLELLQYSRPFSLIDSGLYADVVSVSVYMDNANLLYHSWPDSFRCLFEYALTVNILNPTFHVDVAVLEKCRFRLDVLVEDSEISENVSESATCSRQVDFVLVTSEIELHLSQFCLLQLNAVIECYSRCLSHKAEDQHTFLTPITRYAIVNKTGCPLIVGQYNTPQSILLHSDSVYPYSWLTAERDRLLYVTVASTSLSPEQSFSNSEFFSIDDNFCSTFVRRISYNNVRYPLLINISTVSGGVKRVVNFEGCLSLINLTDIHLKAHVEAKPFSQLFDIVPNSKSPSVLCNHVKMSISLDEDGDNKRLTFVDVSLERKDPCLVRLSSSHRVWCQIVDQSFDGGSVLQQCVVISPVFCAVSLLASSLNVSDNSGDEYCKIRGGGSVCTLDLDPSITHYLTLKVDQECGTSSPALSLSSSLLEQCLKIAEVPAIGDLSKYLFENESWLPPELAIFEDILKPAEQSDIKLNVSFVRRWPWFNTLLLKIYPTTLVVNLTSELLIFRPGTSHTNQSFLPPFTVVASPYEDGTFFVGVLIDQCEYHSSALQLGRHGWLYERSLPAFNGVIPSNGSSRFVVFANQRMGVFCVRSLIRDGVQWIMIHPGVVAVNRTSHSLKMTTIACPWESRDRPLPVANGITLVSASTNRNADAAHQIIWWSLADGISPEPASASAQHKLLIDFTECCDPPLEVSNEMTVISVNGPSHCPCLTVSLSTENGQCCICIEEDESPFLLVENFADLDLSVSFGNVDDDLSFNFVNGRNPLVVLSNSFRYYPEPISKNPALSEGPRRIGILPVNGDGSRITFIDLSSNHIQFLRVEEAHLSVVVSMRGTTFVVQIKPVVGIVLSATHIRHRLERAVNGESTPPLSSSAIKKSQASVESSADKCGAVSTVEESGISEQSLHNNIDSSDQDFIALEPPSSKMQIRASVVCSSISVVLCDDILYSSSRLQEVLRMTIDLAVVAVQPVAASNRHSYCVSLCASAFQIDNQLVSGSNQHRFDVIMASERPCSDSSVLSSAINCRTPLELGCLINSARRRASIFVTAYVNTVTLRGEYCRVRQLEISLRPITVFYDEFDLLELRRYLLSIVQALNAGGIYSICKHSHQKNSHVEYRLSQERMAVVTSQGRRVVLETLHVASIQLVLHVQTKLKLHLSIDGAPLSLPEFTRRSLRCSVHRVITELVQFYVWSAVYRVGTVVGSLDVLADAGGLTRSVSAGVGDLLRMPCTGLMSAGPAGLAAGCVSGVFSLVGHVTAGAVGSMSALSAAVARNLDAVACDGEHWRRAEERRHLVSSSGLISAVSYGLTELGVNLVSAVAGLAQQPIQSAVDTGTPAAVIGGFGRGMIGAVTKPLAAAADLVAHTGRGLLHSTGWRNVLTARRSGQPSHRLFRNMTPASLWFHSRLCFPNDRLVCVFPAVLVISKCSDRKFSDVFVMITSRRVCLLEHPIDSLKTFFSHKIVDVKLLKDPDEPNTVVLIPKCVFGGRVAESEVVSDENAGEIMSEAVGVSRDGSEHHSLAHENLSNDQNHCPGHIKQRRYQPNKYVLEYLRQIEICRHVETPETNSTNTIAQSGLAECSIKAKSCCADSARPDELVYDSETSRIWTIMMAASSRDVLLCHFRSARYRAVEHL